MRLVQCRKRFATGALWATDTRMRVSSRISALAALSVVLVGAGCSGWLNPQDPTTQEPDGGYAGVLQDSRPMVDQVTALSIEPTPGGVIVRATGLPPTQGFWAVGLVRDRAEGQPDGTRRYTLRARPPVDEEGQPVAALVGPVAAREVTSAVFITQADLSTIRTITVDGARAGRSARPR